jgi:hypothetical protein
MDLLFVTKFSILVIFVYLTFYKCTITRVDDDVVSELRTQRNSSTTNGLRLIEIFI